MLRLSHKKSVRLQNGQSKKKVSDSLQVSPCKTSKYDNYTPRKRYMKQQQVLDEYRQQQISCANQQQPFLHQHSTQLRRQEKSPASKRTPLQKANDNLLISQQPFQDSFDRQYQIKTDSPLKDYRHSLNTSTATFRKNKYVTNLANNPVSQKLKFDGIQNQDFSNMVRAKYKNNLNSKKALENIDDELCLTPRRLGKARERHDNSDVNQKLTLLQAKMSRVQKMTPRRSSTPKNSRVVQVQYPQQICLYDLEQEQESVVKSEAGCLTQRQNQIMSRVSLGRLVEQEQCETQIQVIQDLSFKISSKLQSIIRHFG